MSEERRAFVTAAALFGVSDAYVYCIHIVFLDRARFCGAKERDYNEILTDTLCIIITNSELGNYQSSDPRDRNKRKKKLIIIVPMPFARFTAGDVHIHVREIRLIES